MHSPRAADPPANPFPIEELRTAVVASGGRKPSRRDSTRDSSSTSPATVSPTTSRSTGRQRGSSPSARPDREDGCVRVERERRDLGGEPAGPLRRPGMSLPTAVRLRTSNTLTPPAGVGDAMNRPSGDRAIRRSPTYSSISTHGFPLGSHVCVFQAIAMVGNGPPQARSALGGERAPVGRPTPPR